MLKGIFFTIGLLNGAYVGIKMRDMGFNTIFTKNYYGNKKNQNNLIQNLEPKELNELYVKGHLDTPEKLENFSIINNAQDLERMQEILNKEKQEKEYKEIKINNDNKIK